MVRYLDNNSGFGQWNNLHSAPKKSKSFGFFAWVILFLLAWWVLGLFAPRQQTQIVQTKTVDIEKSTAISRTIDSEKISLKNQGLRISNVVLKEHHQNKNTNEALSLLFDENNFIEIGFVSSDAKMPNVNTDWESKSGVLHFGKNVHFTRNISVDGYVIKITDEIKNNSNKEINITPYARIILKPINTKSVAVETGGFVYANSNVDYENWSNLDKKSYAYSTVNGSFGFVEQYWETIVSMDINDQTITLKKFGDEYMADALTGQIKINAGENKTLNTFIYAGPRIGKILDAASNDIPGINKTMDYGWFWFFAQPMLWTINWLYDFVGNYGVAIILMTLILRLLMWPLTRKSYASTMAMQKMQPELQRVQKLYANDKARLQMEMMKIYQTHKTSPMSGCLPMLIQIPIFFALYKALLISVPMRSAHFLWISDLAAMDPYFILPILMGATMWLQQILQSPKNTNNTNPTIANTQRAMKWMPILFTVMFAWMPAGLVLYWTVSNIFGIFQMYIIKKTIK